MQMSMFQQSVYDSYALSFSLVRPCFEVIYELSLINVVKIMSLLVLVINTYMCGCLLPVNIY